MNPDFFAIESKSELIRTVEEHTSDKARSAVEANKLIDACAWQIICKKFFELSDYHDIYGRLVEVGVKLGNSVLQQINVEDESAQWLYDFLVVHYVVYSDKTTIPKLIAKENTDELFGYLQLLAQLEPGHLSHMIDIVAKAVTLEKIYTGLATRALNELTKKSNRLEVALNSTIYVFWDIRRTTAIYHALLISCKK